MAGGGHGARKVKALGPGPSRRRRSSRLAALELSFRGVAQSVWRSGCWICPAAVQPTAPDPYPVFDVATIALVAAGIVSASIAFAGLGAAIARLARRQRTV
jgi:hypothetical protein